MLRRTPLLGGYSDCDRVLLAEIGLNGLFYEVPEYLFIHRQHRDRSVNLYTTRQKRSAWFDPLQAGRPAFPYNKQLHGFLESIRRAPITWRDRARCRILMLKWAFTNGAGLIEDFTFAIRHVLRPVKHRFFPPPTNPGQ
jgi:hypothetical protein